MSNVNSSPRTSPAGCAKTDQNPAPRRPPACRRGEGPLRHVLVASATDDLVEALREAADASTTFLWEAGVDAALERLGRSSRIDAVVTDDPAVEAAIREEIPGSLPVVVKSAGEDPAGTLVRLVRLLS